MGLIGNLKRRRDEHYELSQLRHQKTALEEKFDKMVEGLQHTDSEYNYHLSQYFSDVDHIDSSIAKIETIRTLYRAVHWRVPIPPRPAKRGDSNDVWTWYEDHRRHYLSDEGHSRLRKEIHQEWEMWWKPWLSWMAITISVISLGFSIFRS